MDAALEGDLGGPALVGLDHPPGHLVQAEQVGRAAEVHAGRALGETTAAEGADVGVVDVAVADEGDHVPDGLASQLVDLGHRPHLRPPGREQGDQLVSPGCCPATTPASTSPTRLQRMLEAAQVDS